MCKMKAAYLLTDLLNMSAHVCVYMKIYALKPFEADVGSISPAESPRLSLTAADGRGTSADVIIAPGATSGNSDPAAIL